MEGHAKLLGPILRITCSIYCLTYLQIAAYFLFMVTLWPIKLVQIKHKDATIYKKVSRWPPETRVIFIIGLHITFSWVLLSTRSTHKHTEPLWMLSSSAIQSILSFLIQSWHCLKCLLWQVQAGSLSRLQLLRLYFISYITLSNTHHHLDVIVWGCLLRYELLSSIQLHSDTPSSSAYHLAAFLFKYASLSVLDWSCCCCASPPLRHQIHYFISHHHHHHSCLDST